MIREAILDQIGCLDEKFENDDKYDDYDKYDIDDYGDDKHE